MSPLAALSSGLNSQEARERLQKHGANQIFKPAEISFWGIAREEIVEPMMILLIVTGVLYSLLGELRDAITIFAIIILLVLSEVWTEYRAKAAIAALSKLAALRTRVKRDGHIIEIDTLNVVPDDVLILVQGAKVNADARVMQSIGLQVDESALTGESFPVEKAAGDMIYAGTFIVAGEGEALVTTTGERTRLGQIAAQTREIKIPRTALQLSTKDLAGKLAYVALFFAIAIPLLGFARGQDFKLMLLTGLALAFAVIPEELPIVITMVLGLGSFKLSKHRFLVKQLRTAEALGSTTVIVTDKTGTLTEGHMQVVAIYPPGTNQVLESAIRCAAAYGITPVDMAIKQRAEKLGVASAIPPMVRERDLGDGKKTRAAIRVEGQAYRLYKSGAPEEIFAACSEVPAQARTELQQQTQNGRRVIAVATRPLAQEQIQQPFDQLEQGMDFGGLIVFEDSPRQGVKETIATLAQAGIRTLMVTGDHPATAGYIANLVGMSAAHVLTGEEIDKLSDQALQETVRSVTVFARSTPQHKYRIVKALQANHEVVAVTGDGINDVLALKGADIGIAMGIRGTDVAKEAAAAVLADDNFNTIATGILEGRSFFDNLSKGMKYYLAIKLALVLIFLLPVILGVPMPFAPVQIILLELFMDLAASAGFTAEPKEKNIATRKPRDPKEPVFGSRAIADIAIKAVVLFIAVTGVYLFMLQHTNGLVEAQTFAFGAWIIGHIVLAYISRSDRESVLATGIFSNGVITAWALLAIAALLVGVYVPAVSGLLKLASVPLVSLLVVFVVVIAILLLLELRKLIVVGRSSDKL